MRQFRNAYDVLAGKQKREMGLDESFNIRMP
jgi:hypothetical protein